jgi:hypothetical protein
VTWILARKHLTRCGRNGLSSKDSTVKSKKIVLLYGRTYLFCAEMVLIYSHIGSSRLQYICSFVFKELLGIDYELTIDSDAFKNFTGVKINYSDTKITAAEFYIKNHTLLFDHGIQNQTIDCFIFENNKAFFKTENSDLHFDIFAASFYLLSRYEEYLPHKKDMYGRYAHENSLAYQEGFLHLPLVNIWVKAFAEKLKQKFAQDVLGKTFNFQLSTFNFKLIKICHVQ